MMDEFNKPIGQCSGCGRNLTNDHKCFAMPNIPKDYNPFHRCCKECARDIDDCICEQLKATKLEAYREMLAHIGFIIHDFEKWDPIMTENPGVILDSDGDYHISKDVLNSFINDRIKELEKQEEK